MEKDEDVGHQPRVLPSRQIKLMEQISNALTLPDEGVALFTAWAHDLKAHPKLRLAGIKGYVII